MEVGGAGHGCLIMPAKELIVVQQLDRLLMFGRRPPPIADEHSAIMREVETSPRHQVIPRGACTKDVGSPAP